MDICLGEDCFVSIDDDYMLNLYISNNNNKKEEHNKTDKLGLVD